MERLFIRKWITGNTRSFFGHDSIGNGGVKAGIVWRDKKQWYGRGVTKTLHISNHRSPLVRGGLIHLLLRESHHEVEGTR